MAWDSIGTSYDRVAGRYEARFLDELDAKPRDRELLHALAGSVGDPVIEVGCGPGQVGRFVQAAGRRVVGLDLSPGMAALATARLDDAVVADMRLLPVRDAGVGGIIAFYSLIHLRREDLCDALSEFHRVLRPGGRALFSAHEGDGDVEVDRFLDQDVHVGVTFYRLDELVAATEAAGLIVRTAERRPPYATEGDTFRLYVEAER